MSGSADIDAPVRDFAQGCYRFPKHHVTAVLDPLALRTAIPSERFHVQVNDQSLSDELRPGRLAGSGTAERWVVTGRLVVGTVIKGGAEGADGGPGTNQAELAAETRRISQTTAATAHLRRPHRPLHP